MSMKMRKIQRENRSKISTGGFLLTAFAVTLSSQSAFGLEKIPFNFDNQIDKKVTVQCFGPWSRKSKPVTVKANSKHKDFYAAEVTIFSPFGDWYCQGTPEGSNSSSDIEFCLKKESPQPALNFGMAYYDEIGDSVFLEGQGVFSETCDKTTAATSVTSTLGDNPSPFWYDTDSYRMQGSAGDLLKISIEGESAGGYQGDRITLKLIHEKGSFKQHLKGQVPLEMEATLPQDGVYRIILKPHGKSGKNQLIGSGQSGPFRGGYVINVTTSGDSIELIPHSDVEE